MNKITNKNSTIMNQTYFSSNLPSQSMVMNNNNNPGDVPSAAPAFSSLYSFGNGGNYGDARPNNYQSPFSMFTNNNWTTGNRRNYMNNRNNNRNDKMNYSPEELYKVLLYFFFVFLLGCILCRITGMGMWNDSNSVYGKWIYYSLAIIFLLFGILPLYREAKDDDNDE